MDYFKFDGGNIKLIDFFRLADKWTLIKVYFKYHNIDVQQLINNYTTEFYRKQNKMMRGSI